MSEVMEKPEVKEPKAAKAAPRKVKVTIHSGEDKGDKGDVFLSYNYKPILIQRDQPVEIDVGYLECLKHSIVETVVKNDKNEEVAIRIPRYNYSVEPL
jgi:hypothetical protein